MRPLVVRCRQLWRKVWPLPHRFTEPARLPPSLTTPAALPLEPADVAPDDNPLWQHFRNRNDRSIHKWHHYFPIYHGVLASKRGLTSFRLLEIGVHRGGSLGMWRSYFDAGAVIVGLDIDPQCQQYEQADRGIHVRIGDQEDPRFLADVAGEFGPFDVIIDDGGHTTAQQIASFCALYNDHLGESGIYMVEDLHTNCWPPFITSRRGQTFVGLAKRLVDCLYDPYWSHRNLDFFAINSPTRLRNLNVCRFCATTESITFHDSVIVFQKRRKRFPYVEQR